MCSFLSVLILKNGDVLHHPMLDSHSDLVAHFDLPDTNAYIHHFATAELMPVDWLDPATWTWHINEHTRQPWLDEVETQAEDTARSIARRMIFTDTTKIPRLIVDGCWIVGGNAVVRDVRGGRIVRVQDTAQVSDVWGSAQVSGVRDSARVSGVMDSARVSGVRDSAQVFDVGDSAQVSDVRDSAQVFNVRGSAQVSDVRGSAQVFCVGGSAQVSDVRGSAQVSDVRDYARVFNVWETNVLLDASAKAHLVQTVTASGLARHPSG